MSNPILITRDGAVTTVTLNRPEKRNALNVALLEALCEAVAETENDSSQRILVLRGSGPVFCSGLDLQEAADATIADASAEQIGRALEALSTTRLATIAMVHGAAIAGGAGLMSACDFAVATVAARFAYPELRRGIVPALIMTFLRRQVREREARELLLLGKPFDARHAHAIGLLNGIVADAAALETEVRSLISSLLQGAPAAMAETKRLLGDLWPVSIAADLERAHAHHLSARGSAEAREGIAAFNEKRAPNWAPGDGR
jgi:methylglutaconyl-CoA hydratase